MNSLRRSPKPFMPAYMSATRQVMLAPERPFANSIVEAAMVPGSTEINVGPGSLLSRYLQDDVFPSIVLDSLKYNEAIVVSPTVIEKRYGDVIVRVDLCEGRIHCMGFRSEERLFFPIKATARIKAAIKEDILDDARSSECSGKLRSMVKDYPEFFRQD